MTPNTSVKRDAPSSGFSIAFFSAARALYLNRYAFKKVTALYLALTKEKPWNFLLY